MRGERGIWQITRRAFARGAVSAVAGAAALAWGCPALAAGAADSQGDAAAAPAVRAVNPTTLWAGQLDTLPYPPACMVETNLGDVVAEAFLRAAADAREAGRLPAKLADAPVVALERGGNLRGSLARGIVSTDDVGQVFGGQGEEVGVVAVTPRILHDVLEEALATLVAQDPSTGILEGVPSGDTPQLANVRVTCDASLPQGSRVTAMALESGEALDPTDDTTQILLVTCDYALSGAYPYETLAGRELLAGLGSEAEVVKAFLARLMLADADAPGDGEARAASVTADVSSVDERAKGGQSLGALPIIASTRGRLRLEGAFVPHDWDACVLATDRAGAPLPAARVRVLVDGAYALDLETDEAGYLSVPLADGPHALACATDADAGVASLPADAQTSSERLDAAARTLEAIDGGALAQEAYVSNYLGLGLVEDDVRAFPRLVCA